MTMVTGSFYAGVSTASEPGKLLPLTAARAALSDGTANSAFRFIVCVLVLEPCLNLA